MCMPGSRADFLRRTGCIYTLALLFNAILGIHSWFPDHQWILFLIPVPEALIFTWLMGYGKRTVLPASLILPLFTALSAGEALFRHIYKRPFDPVANLPLASRFFAMFIRKTDIPLMVFIPGLILLYLLFAWLLRLLFIPVAAVFSRCLPDAKSSPKALSVLLPLLIISVVLTPYPPVLRSAESVIGTLFPRQKQVESIIESYEEIEAKEKVVKKEREADIHLFIVESYGMTVFTNPDHRKRILPFLKEQEMLLRSKGFTILSSGYRSTTFGGTSWLADASILSGLKIDTQEKYNRVIEASSRNIIHFLKEKGYLTVLSAPGTSYMTEKYLGFYAYDHLFLYDDFGYEGPYFTFGEMPDQYHLYTVQRDLLSGLNGEAPPIFVEYILCSSHVPWNYIPPYIESWEGFDNGKVYFDREKNSWYDNSWASGSELFEGYDHSIRYSLETVIGFISTYLDPEAIAIIIGDHQPKFPVSEKGADFSVPIHIVSAGQNRIDGFLDQGYGGGIIPPKLEALPSLETFLPALLKTLFGETGESGE